MSDEMPRGYSLAFDLLELQEEHTRRSIRFMDIIGRANFGGAPITDEDRAFLAELRAEIDASVSERMERRGSEK